MSKSEHRPEPFTTLDNFANHGFQASVDDNDGWFVVAQTKRSISAALRYLELKGCKKVSLLLNIIPEPRPYEYRPVCCYTEPETYRRAFDQLDFEKLERKPTLYFRLDTYSGEPSAFIHNG